MRSISQDDHRILIYRYENIDSDYLSILGAYQIKYNRLEYLGIFKRGSSYIIFVQSLNPIEWRSKDHNSINNVVPVEYLPCPMGMDDSMYKFIQDELFYSLQLEYGIIGKFHEVFREIRLIR